MNINLSAENIEFIYEQMLFDLNSFRDYLKDPKEEDKEVWEYRIEQTMKVIERLEKKYNDVQGSENAAKDFQESVDIRV